MARDIPLSRAYQQKRGLAVRKIPDNSHPSSEFTVDPLRRVVCADTAPVSRGKVVVGEGFFGASLHQYHGCLIKTKINEAINYFRDEAPGYL